MSRSLRGKVSTPAEYVVDRSNPNRIRVWVRADIFGEVARSVDLDDRRAGAELAIERLQTQLRRRVA